MKNKAAIALLVILLNTVSSCSEADEVFPVKVTNSEFIFQDAEFTGYLFTLYNDSNEKVEPLSFDVQIYEVGLRDEQHRDYYLVKPYEEIKILVVFHYSVLDQSLVSFKYKLK